MGERVLLAVFYKNNKLTLNGFGEPFQVLTKRYGGLTIDLDWVESLRVNEIEWPEFRRRVVEGTNPKPHCSAKLLHHENELRLGGRGNARRKSRCH
jgi:hypothetical protein